MEREEIKMHILAGLELYNIALGKDIFDDSKLGENFERLVEDYLVNFNSLKG